MLPVVQDLLMGHEQLGAGAEGWPLLALVLKVVGLRPDGPRTRQALPCLIAPGAGRGSVAFRTS